MLSTSCYDHNPWSCSRNMRLPPCPLRLFQSSPAHSWRCDSFQRTSPSPSTRPEASTEASTTHSYQVTDLQKNRNQTTLLLVTRNISQHHSHTHAPALPRCVLPRVSSRQVPLYIRLGIYYIDLNLLFSIVSFARFASFPVLIFASSDLARFSEVPLVKQLFPGI